MPSGKNNSPLNNTGLPVRLARKHPTAKSTNNSKIKAQAHTTAPDATPNSFPPRKNLIPAAAGLRFTTPQRLKTSNPSPIPMAAVSKSDAESATPTSDMSLPEKASTPPPISGIASTAPSSNLSLTKRRQRRTWNNLSLYCNFPACC